MTLVAAAAASDGNGDATTSISSSSVQPPSTTLTLVDAALQVLREADPFEKARIGEEVAARWLNGDISVAYRSHADHKSNSSTIANTCGHLLPPDRPARSDIIDLVPSNLMHKLGKGGSLRSRQSMVHSLVHIESWAVDLSWDIIARFGRTESMPNEFFTDFVRVAQDEGRHFTLLAARLCELGSFYGAFPAHDGLWDSAMDTSNSLLARLAVEHCVHEARGLDVLPITISRFRSGGDEETASLLEKVIYPEEIAHCAAGVKWFSYLCNRQIRTEIGKPVTSSSSTLDAVIIQTFHGTVREHFRGSLKPPFNKQARDAAGFHPDWYEPLAIKF